MVKNVREGIIAYSICSHAVTRPKTSRATQLELQESWAVDLLSKRS